MKSKSDVILGQIDYFKRKEIENELQTYSATVRVTKDISIAFPQKASIVNKTSFWEDNRYLSSVGIKDLEEQNAVISRLNSPGYFRLLKLRMNAERGSNDFVLTKNLDNMLEPETVAIFLIDGEEFIKFILNNQADSNLDFSILQNEEIIYSFASKDLGEKSIYEKLIKSERYNWFYNIRIEKPSDNRFGYFAFAIFSFSLAIIAGLFSAYFLAGATYNPTRKLLQKMGLKTEKNQLEYIAIENHFVELKAENERLDLYSRELYLAAKKQFTAEAFVGRF